MSPKKNLQSYIKNNEEVFFVDKKNFSLSSRDINYLLGKAKKSKRQRARLCVHDDINSNLHEMFIAKLKNTYVRPHKNFNKCKSFEVLEGEMDLIIFDENGEIIEVIEMCEYGHMKCFFYRITDTIYHSLIIRSNHALFKETITGPFKNQDTIYADWSPHETDLNKVHDFMENTLKNINLLLNLKN